MNETPQDHNPQQQQAGRSTSAFEFLKSAFGPAFVTIRNDVMNRGLMTLGSDPLPISAIDPDIQPTPSLPAGVLIGKESGLLGLSFPAEEGLKSILAANPVLSGALALCNRSAHILWLRPVNPLPPAQKLKDAAILSDTAVLPLFCPSSRASTVSIYQRGVPLAIDLAALVLTGRLNDVITDWLLKVQHGEPVLKVNKRRRELNVGYWTAWMAKMTGLQFDVGRAVFVAGLPGEKPNMMGANQVPLLVATLLQQARRSGVPIPPEEIQPRRIHAIISGIKMFHSFNDATEQEVLNEFVAAFIEAKPEGVLSKNAVTAACLAYRKARGLPEYNEDQLRFNLRQTILQRFGIGESHHKGRVFCGLGLRSRGDMQRATSQAAKSTQANEGNTGHPRTPSDSHGQPGRADGQSCKRPEESPEPVSQTKP